MIDHDRLFKELISTFFVEFLELFLPQVVREIDRESIQFLPQEVFNDVTSGDKKEMEIVTSWERKARQEAQETIAINLLREGLSVELVIKTTGLSLERVRELQGRLSQDN